MSFSSFLLTNYSNVNKSNCFVFYPNNNEDIQNIFKLAKKENKKILCIGSSQSWYDTIFNSNNFIINLKNYKKIFDLNKNDKTLIISSSYKIKEVLENINQYGLSLFSIPGSLDVTIGGCISNDVHGKDSFKYGNFGENVIEIEIILSNGDLITCSREKNRELFLSTIGGLGLMGVITKIKIKLKDVSSVYETENFRCDNYKILIENLYNKREDYDYIYGWVDLLSKNNSLGRGIIFKSKKLFKQKKISENRFIKKNLFIFLKTFVFKFFTRFNLFIFLNLLFFYFHFFRKKKINSYQEIINTLNTSGVELKDICPPYSFFDVQVILKKETLPHSLSDFIIQCQELGLKGSIIGIKMHKKNDNYLSFSDNGTSINITNVFQKKDKNKLELKFKELYKFLIKNNHKVYIAKDFFFNKEIFFKNYKNANKFFSLKEKYDKDFMLYSDFLKRIGK